MPTIRLILFLCAASLGLANQSLEDFPIKQTNFEIMQIDDFLKNPNNIWMKKYANFVAYQEITQSIHLAKIELKKLESQKPNQNNQNLINNLLRNLNTLKQQQSLLDEFKNTPFEELIKPHKIEELPNITNPILIVRGFSFIKQINQELETLKQHYASLDENLKALEQKQRLLNQLLESYKQTPTPTLQNICQQDCLFADAQAIKQELKRNTLAIQEFQSAQNIFNTTLEIFTKTIQDNTQNLKDQIKNQAIKGAYIGFSVVFLIIIAFIIKIIIRKYIHNDDRIYTTNKIINFLNITLILLLLLFAYLDNVTYLVTVLGFASAGLAIAMKDLFMSLLGWIVIVVSGVVHVGDRIRVLKEGALYLGDVLDISILRITIYEDITLTSYTQNRRAGRIIFIPNNFVFTTMFANYTHGGLQTVWDGIDFTITFQSNHAKACNIARECAKKYAKGYTDSTKKQHNKLRDRYSFRNASVEPRVFSFLEPNGIRISVWYLTNAYATLALRSSISAEIIEEILKEPTIHIAYPSTTIYNGSQTPTKTDGQVPMHLLQSNAP